MWTAKTFKSKIVREIGHITKYRQDAVAEVINLMLDIIMREVANGEKVMLRDFGTFYPKQFPARTIVDFRTGEQTLETPPIATPAFKPGLAFKKKLKQKDSAKNN